MLRAPLSVLGLWLVAGLAAAPANSDELKDLYFGEALYYAHQGLYFEALERLDTEVSSPLEKTLYANSITLTPGTLTTDVRDDYFLVHSLSREGLEELRHGEMQRRVRRLGL